MKQVTKRSWWLLVLPGGFIALDFILGNVYSILSRITIPLFLIALLVLSAMMMWARATAHATGDEWWQDDSASGWRGY